MDDASRRIERAMRAREESETGASLRGTKKDPTWVGNLEIHPESRFKPGNLKH